MTPQRLRGTAFALVATFLFVGAVVPATRARLDRLLVLTAVAFAAAAARRRFGVGTRPAPEIRWRDAGEPAPADEQDVRLARLDASLESAAFSGEQFWRVTRPALRRMATERLLLRRGIDVTADPEGARRQMGEDLWVMFATPPDHAGPAPGPERLRALVERLEHL